MAVGTLGFVFVEFVGMTDERHSDGYTAGLPTASRRPSDRLSGIVAIIIAFATLVAAVAGFLQADASNQAGDRRDEAEQLSLAGPGQLAERAQTAQVELETFARWVEQRTEAGNALLAEPLRGRRPDARRTRCSWSSSAGRRSPTATLKQIDSIPASEFGPEKDPTFPQRYFAAATEESLRLNALQDAANEEATSSTSARRPTRPSWRRSRSPLPVRPDAGRQRALAAARVPERRPGAARRRLAVDGSDRVPARLQDKR